MMKFCPNCGSVLEGKLKCICGYNVETGEIEEQEQFLAKEKTLYERSCDNRSMMLGMGNDTIHNPELNQIIFNKDNDNLYAKELAKIMSNTDRNQAQDKSNNIED